MGVACTSHHTVTDKNWTEPDVFFLFNLILKDKTSYHYALSLSTGPHDFRRM